MQALSGALVRQACVIGYKVGSFNIIKGAASAAAWLLSVRAGIILLKVASALNSL
jgi:hypothetical protein